MNSALPQVYLVRHGETAWTLSGQHTGRTNIPLTEQGEHAARELGALDCTACSGSAPFVS